MSTFYYNNSSGKKILESSSQMRSSPPGFGRIETRRYPAAVAGEVDSEEILLPVMVTSVQSGSAEPQYSSSHLNVFEVARPAAVVASRSSSDSTLEGDSRFQRFRWIIECELQLADVTKEQLAEMFKAMTHPSAVSNDRQMQQEFQRWEWIGDSVLNLCISNALLRANPGSSESDLSRKRTLLVREPVLAQWARAIYLSDDVLALQGNTIPSDGILADVVEALIGNCFLFCGLQVANRMVHALLNMSIGQVQGRPALNPKTTLQDWCIAVHGVSPVYELVSAEGPEHRPEFKSRVKIIVNGVKKAIAEGTGSTRQQSEESAALKLFQSPVPIPQSSMALQSASNASPEHFNLKGQVQERVVPVFGSTVEYKLLDEIGPSNLPFQVRAGLPEWTYVTAMGASRKEAENEAAYQLLQHIKANGVTRQRALEPKATPTPAMLLSNPKGRLQELFQPKGLLPRYELVGRTGEDHSPTFYSQVFLSNDDRPLGEGSGKSKKKAEEEAALDALKKLDVLSS